MLVQAVELTPSINFEFEDQQNTFDYSNTPALRSNYLTNFSFPKPLQQDTTFKDSSLNQRGKLKTFEVFEEFDKNFVVIFGDEAIENIEVKSPEKSSRSPVEHDSNNHENNDENEKDTHRRQSLSPARQKTFTLLPFDAKKRMGFKHLENLPFFKRKKHPFLAKEEEPFVITSLSCVWQQTKQNRLITAKVSTGKLPHKKIQRINQHKGSLFSAGFATYRQVFQRTLRSTTLDTWKNKFNIKKRKTNKNSDLTVVTIKNCR